MFIHYTTVTWILNIIDLYIGIPVSDVGYLGIQLIVASISLVIFDKWEELGKFLPEEEMEQEAKAITINQYGASLVAINSKRGNSIVHEALHIKNNIWKYIGYTPQVDNDEVDAYLLTYIYKNDRMKS